MCHVILSFFMNLIEVIAAIVKLTDLMRRIAPDLIKKISERGQIDLEKDSEREIYLPFRALGTPPP